MSITNNSKHKKPCKFQVGDKVCYARSFLQSTGQLTGDLPFARGTVTDVSGLGGNYLITIDWNDDSIPRKALEDALSKISKERGIEESV